MRIHSETHRRLDCAYFEVVSIDRESRVCCRRLVPEDHDDLQSALEFARIENANAIEKFISEGGNAV